MLDLYQSTIDFLQKNKFHPSKKMGQNFLINSDICNSIYKCLPANKNYSIIEIGPGLGALTQYLILKTNKYIGIELDKRLFSFLQKQFNNENIQFINNDVLKVDFSSLSLPLASTIIVANLPYTISSLIIKKFIIQNEIKKMYVMLQKEMVERITAKTNTSGYNGFSLLVGRYTKIEKLINVGRSNFIPQPKVDSIVVCLERNKLVFNVEYESFIKNCFQEKRRTLHNNLKRIYDSKMLPLIFKKLKINELIRAEALDDSTLYNLFIALQHEKKS